MSFGRVVNGAITFPYTVQNFYQDFPNTSPPVSFFQMSEENRNAFGIVPVSVAAQPELLRGEKAELNDPVLVEGVWTRQWTVSPIFVYSVTMRQARLALLAAGLLSQIEASVNAIVDDTEREAASIEWQYAHTVDRDSPLVAAVLTQLEVSEAVVNNLFYEASLL